ncbi:hypothetical protein DFJ73DRAFT_804156 [Zopfochytrium polystomum]|nr:hypothetical protein DFJ73DRAFT_804156 [Zopfochytrium polystomum]
MPQGASAPYPPTPLLLLLLILVLILLILLILLTLRLPSPLTLRQPPQQQRSSSSSSSTSPPHHSHPRPPGLATALPHQHHHHHQQQQQPHPQTRQRRRSSPSAPSATIGVRVTSPASPESPSYAMADLADDPNPATSRDPPPLPALPSFAGVARPLPPPPRFAIGDDAVFATATAAMASVAAAGTWRRVPFTAVRTGSGVFPAQGLSGASDAAAAATMLGDEEAMSTSSEAEEEEMMRMMLVPDVDFDAGYDDLDLFGDAGAGGGDDRGGGGGERYGDEYDYDDGYDDYYEENDRMDVGGGGAGAGRAKTGDREVAARGPPPPGRFAVGDGRASANSGAAGAGKSRSAAALANVLFPNRARQSGYYDEDDEEEDYEDEDDYEDYEEEYDDDEYGEDDGYDRDPRAVEAASATARRDAMEGVVSGGPMRQPPGMTVSTAALVPDGTSGPGTAPATASSRPESYALLDRDWTKFEYVPVPGVNQPPRGLMERISAILRRKEEELMLKKQEENAEDDGLTTLEKKIKLKEKALNERQGLMKLDPMTARANAIQLILSRRLASANASLHPETATAAPPPEVKSTPQDERAKALGMLAARAQMRAQANASAAAAAAAPAVSTSSAVPGSVVSAPNGASAAAAPPTSRLNMLGVLAARTNRAAEAQASKADTPQPPQPPSVAPFVSRTQVANADAQDDEMADEEDEEDEGDEEEEDDDDEPDHERVEVWSSWNQSLYRSDDDVDDDEDEEVQDAARAREVPTPEARPDSEEEEELAPVSAPAKPIAPRRTVSRVPAVEADKLLHQHSNVDVGSLPMPLTATETQPVSDGAAQASTKAPRPLSKSKIKKPLVIPQRRVFNMDSPTLDTLTADTDYRFKPLAVAHLAAQGGSGAVNQAVDVPSRASSLAPAAMFVDTPPLIPTAGGVIVVSDLGMAELQLKQMILTGEAGNDAFKSIKNWVESVNKVSLSWVDPLTALPEDYGDPEVMAWMDALDPVDLSPTTQVAMFQNRTTTSAQRGSSKMVGAMLSDPNVTAAAGAAGPAVVGASKGAQMLPPSVSAPASSTSPTSFQPAPIAPNTQTSPVQTIPRPIPQPQQPAHAPLSTPLSIPIPPRVTIPAPAQAQIGQQGQMPMTSGTYSAHSQQTSTGGPSPMRSAGPSPLRDAPRRKLSLTQAQFGQAGSSAQGEQQQQPQQQQQPHSFGFLGMAKRRSRSLTRTDDPSLSATVVAAAGSGSLWNANAGGRLYNAPAPASVGATATATAATSLGSARQYWLQRQHPSSPNAAHQTMQAAPAPASAVPKSESPVSLVDPALGKSPNTGAKMASTSPTAAVGGSSPVSSAAPTSAASSSSHAPWARPGTSSKIRVPTRSTSHQVSEILSSPLRGVADVSSLDNLRSSGSFRRSVRAAEKRAARTADQAAGTTAKDDEARTSDELSPSSSWKLAQGAFQAAEPQQQQQIAEGVIVRSSSSPDAISAPVVQTVAQAPEPTASVRSASLSPIVAFWHHGAVYHILSVSVVKKRHMFLFTDVLVVTKRVRASTSTKEKEGKSSATATSRTPRHVIEYVLDLTQARLRLSAKPPRDPAPKKPAGGNSQTNVDSSGSAVVAAAAAESFSKAVSPSSTASTPTTQRRRSMAPPITPTFTSLDARQIPRIRRQFRQDPVQTLANLISRHRLQAMDVPVFLHVTPGLAAGAVGRFLAHPEHVAFLEGWMGCIEMRGWGIEEALRAVLGRVFIDSAADGGEGAMDRFLHAFVRRWVACQESARSSGAEAAKGASGPVAGDSGAVGPATANAWWRWGGAASSVEAQQRVVLRMVFSMLAVNAEVQQRRIMAAQQLAAAAAAKTPMPVQPYAPAPPPAPLPTVIVSRQESHADLAVFIDHFVNGVARDTYAHAPGLAESVTVAAAAAAQANAQRQSLAVPMARIHRSISAHPLKMAEPYDPAWGNASTVTVGDDGLDATRFRWVWRVLPAEVTDAAAAIAAASAAAAAEEPTSAAATATTAAAESPKTPRAAAATTASEPGAVLPSTVTALEPTSFVALTLMFPSSSSSAAAAAAVAATTPLHVLHLHGTHLAADPPVLVFSRAAPTQAFRVTATATGRHVLLFTPLPFTPGSEAGGALPATPVAVAAVAAAAAAAAASAGQGVVPAAAAAAAATTQPPAPQLRIPRIPAVAVVSEPKHLRHRFQLALLRPPQQPSEPRKYLFSVGENHALATWVGLLAGMVQQRGGGGGGRAAGGRGAAAAAATTVMGGAAGGTAAARGSSAPSEEREAWFRAVREAVLRMGTAREGMEVGQLVERVMSILKEAGGGR